MPSDKLLINLFGLIISADGIYAVSIRPRPRRLWSELHARRAMMCGRRIFRD